jgi:predicted lipid-binding transport protein (Tim44 family)
MQHFLNDYLDIIIFAVIAVVLLWRLHSVFGTRSESDLPPINKSVTLPPQGKAQLKELSVAVKANDKAQAQQQAGRWAQGLPDFNYVASATVHNTLTQFPAFDPEFRPDDFMDKAKKTFALVVQAYAGGNKNTLEMLLSPTLFRHFAEQIDLREKAKETYFTQLHGLQKALISDASLEGSNARITADFIAEQSITHKNADGTTIDNRDGKRIVTRDRWVFTRDLKASSPFWILDDTLEHAE